MFSIRALASSAALLALGAVTACSAEKSGSDAATVDTAMPVSTMAPSPDTGMATSRDDMASMANMTGDPDRDFLRMMSDHHMGMIAMAHPTMDFKGELSVKDEAKKLDKNQDAELEKMSTMLSKQWNDDYTPSIMPSNQKMVNDLSGKSGNDYSRTFLKNVVMHHTQALKMIDEYLPKAKNAEVKRMAEKMKADQAREIAEFNKKLASLGA